MAREPNPAAPEAIDAAETLEGVLDAEASGLLDLTPHAESLLLELIDSLREEVGQENGR
jgi:hypothetical protein